MESVGFAGHVAFVTEAGLARGTEEICPDGTKADADERAATSNRAKLSLVMVSVYVARTRCSDRFTILGIPKKRAIYQTEQQFVQGTEKIALCVNY